MATDIFNQTVFSVYDFFANIIPGMLIIVTVLFLINFGIVIPSSTLAQSIIFIFLVFLAFIIGLGIQGLSASLENYINLKKYGGYPSSHYLDEKDDTFPKYFKDRIREIANKKFGTPLDSSSSHIFDVCYTYVMQKNISARVVQFLRTYTFSRNMVITMIVESIILFFTSVQQHQLWFILAGILALASSYLFYKRSLRYGESFAKEVLRSFIAEGLQ